MIKYNTASFHQKRKDKIYQELVLETLKKKMVQETALLH